MIKIHVMCAVVLSVAFGCKPATKESAQDSTAAPITTDTDTVTDEMLGNAKADEYFENEEAALINFETDMVGSLRKPLNGGGQKLILLAMHLKSENGNVTGKYFYANSKQRTDIALRGTMEGDSVVLEEYDRNNNITGRFNGRMGDTFEGEWSSPDNKKNYFFKIKGDDRTYAERKTIGVREKDLEID